MSISLNVENVLEMTMLAIASIVHDINYFFNINLITHNLRSMSSNKSSILTCYSTHLVEFLNLLTWKFLIKLCIMIIFNHKFIKLKMLEENARIAKRENLKEDVNNRLSFQLSRLSWKYYEKKKTIARVKVRRLIVSTRQSLNMRMRIELHSKN